MCLLASATLLAQEKKCNQTVAACEQEIRQMLSGRLYLGIEIEEKNSGLVIKTVVPDSPAWRAGFEQGDRIMSINAHPTASATIKDFKQVLNQIFQDPRRVTRFYIMVIRRGMLTKVDARPEPYSKAQIDKIIAQHLLEAHQATAQGPPRP
jgi:predicted metalloprotease with PDZ domain